MKMKIHPNLTRTSVGSKANRVFVGKVAIAIPIPGGERKF